MGKYDIVVGIDPDIEKSGFCVLDVGKRELLQYEGKKFAYIIKHAPELVAGNYGKRILFCVEAGWLVQKNNYHHAGGFHQAEKIAHDVGQNHAVGKMLIELLSVISGADTIAVHPLKKMWNGPNGKITQAELEGIVGQKLKRTNQDVRDAILLAWYMADLPIVVR